MAERENGTSQLRASMCIKALHMGCGFYISKTIAYEVFGPVRERAVGELRERRGQIKTPPPLAPAT